MSYAGVKLVREGATAMSYDDFLQTIASPDLTRIARHWNDARGGRVMPGWHDIHPAQIASQLPKIWVYRYDREADLFTGRLAGYHIEQFFGKSFRGTPMKKLYSEEDYPRLFARVKRVACEPALFRSEGMVFKHIDRYGQGERIIMPLGDDGALGDGIFGATAYEAHRGTPAEDAQENESWFAL
jgi:hypothetical protein